jgi:hypothetical protein
LRFARDGQPFERIRNPPKVKRQEFRFFGFLDRDEQPAA